MSKNPADNVGRIGLYHSLQNSGAHDAVRHTFGPFEVPRDDYGNVSASLSDFWEEVDAEWAGLSEGRGCYIFGVSPSGGNRVEPWYVGKTNRQGFASECFTPHKLNHYHYALSIYNRGKPQLFLIAQFGPDGERLYRGSSGSAIDFLETYLIGTAIGVNKELRNKQDTKLYKEVVFPGFLNSPPGNPTGGAIKLKESLRMT